MCGVQDPSEMFHEPCPVNVLTRPNDISILYVERDRDGYQSKDNPWRCDPGRPVFHPFSNQPRLTTATPDALASNDVGLENDESDKPTGPPLHIF